MKVLSWILMVISTLAGLIFSVFCWVSSGLGLAGTAFGEVVHILGILALAVSILGALLSIRKMRKGNLKKALVFALMGLIYCAVIVAGILIDEAAHTMMFEKSIAEYKEQQYGENWDSAPAIEGIPELYQEVLNEFYAVVRDRWPADRLMNLRAVSMADYYGDAPLDNIGFVLTDLNGDNVDEIVIGTVVHADQQGNEIFCIYTDFENPFCAISSVEGEVYYLHAGEAEDTYEVESAGSDIIWVIEPAEQENTFDFNFREGTMDPDGRITLEMIPFSRYK